MNVFHASTSNHSCSIERYGSNTYLRYHCPLAIASVICMKIDWLKSISKSVHQTVIIIVCWLLMMFSKKYLTKYNNKMKLTILLIIMQTANHERWYFKKIVDVIQQTKLMMNIFKNSDSHQLKLLYIVHIFNLNVI